MEEVSLVGELKKHVTPPSGVFWWAKWDKKKIPNIHVYKYLYTYGDKLVFAHRSGKFYFSITFLLLEKEIDAGRFKPFLLNKEYFEHYNKRKGRITDAYL